MRRVRKMNSDEIRFTLNADQMEDGRLFLTSSEMEGFASIIDEDHGIEEMMPALQAFASLHFDKELRGLHMIDARPNVYSFVAKVCERVGV
jgi:hypothetical protein